MAAAHCLDNQFSCPICLDAFTDPVSTPCGHNFCKKCITEHWDASVSPQCPVCNKFFYTRPELQTNTLISEMAAQLSHEARQETSSRGSEQQAAEPGEASCDVCTGTKVKAVKSCLVCLNSYCEAHLEPHLTKLSLERHQLIDAVENLEERLCKKHDKALELFCRTDHTCVCVLCPYSGHKTHDVVPLKEESEGKKAELRKTGAEIQQMIQERRRKIQEIQSSVELSNKDADRELAEGVRVFAALKESMERGQAELVENINAKRRTTEKQAEDFISELQQQISELRRRSDEVEQLLRCEDHLHLIQSFPSVSSAPPTNDWTDVSICLPLYKGTVVRAVHQLKETLSEQMMKLVSEAKLNRVKHYATSVTLDPDSARSDLILSDDGKQVKHGDVTRNLPEKPERFSHCTGVLGKESFSTGKFYYEVQVKGKTAWDLGVVRGSINRKGPIKANPQHGFWTLCLRNDGQYYAGAYPPVRLSLKCGPEKVGVFVDYLEGLVSFYDADSADLIYSFTGCYFTEELYPYFGPCPNDGGSNSAPLIICPVNRTK